MANRYWVGGTGTWNSSNTLNWSSVSGGMGGASVPTSVDDVFFNTLSSAVSYAVTTGADAICRSISVDAPMMGSVTFANSATPIQIYGSFTTASAGVIWSLSSGRFEFRSTSTGNTITTNGAVFLNGILFDGVGGEWILQDNYTSSSESTITITNGSLNLNDKTLTIGLFSSSNSNSRTINFGTGKFVLSGSAGTILNMTTMTNMNVSGSKNVEFTYSGSTGTRTISHAAIGGGATEVKSFNLKFIGGSDILSFPANRFCGTLDFDTFSGTLTNSSYMVYGDLKISPSMTMTGGTGTITMAATTGTKTITTSGVVIDQSIGFNGNATFVFADALTQGTTRTFSITRGTVKLRHSATSVVGSFVTFGLTPKTLQSTLDGTQATLSQASGTVNVNNLYIKDINATGGATWNAFLVYGNTDGRNNTGWDFTSQFRRYMYNVRKNKVLLPTPIEV